jgi:RHS repeat-associated protein
LGIGAGPAAGADDWWFGANDVTARPLARAASPNDDPGSRPAAQSPDQDQPLGGGSVPVLPAITLPKGGGAIRGIDEKLTVGLPTGAAQLTVPVFTSAARQGFGPQLSLRYDSGAGNGPYGIGWSLSPPSITRKTSLGLPRYEDASDSDVFILSGAEDLVPLLVPSSTAVVGASSFDVKPYRPRVEGAFARIERWQDAVTGDVHWRTVSKDNVTSIFGEDPSSRIADPDNPARVFSWLLALSFDDRGNAIRYQYKVEDDRNVPSTAAELGRTVTANQYLKHIFYGNQTPYVASGALPTDWCFEVVFDYGEHDLAAPTPTELTTWPCRPDPFSSYRSAFEVRTLRTCRRILMFHLFKAELGAEPVIVRSTDLDYTPATAPNPQLPEYTLLGSITQTGWVRDPVGGGFQTAQLPPLTLSYSPLTIDDTLRAADADSVANVPGNFDTDRRRWIDLFGEGLEGILTEDDTAWYYKRNLSAWSPDGQPGAAWFAPLEPVATKPKLTAEAASLQLTNLNGDGHLAAVNFSSQPAGWFELCEDGEWTPLRTFDAVPNVDWASPNLRFVDLDGDGLADVLITEDEVLSWYQWLVDCGFAEGEWVRKPSDEDLGPALVFADGTNTVLLADMGGDGMSDLVRIRNGEVCYWPNLGHGRFGHKVTMDAAPVFDYPDRFDPRRVRLADIDGAGPADIVYLGSDATTVWFNQSGNSWTTGRVLPEFPPVDDVAQATVFDLLGTGTASATWTSPLPGDAGEPLRYIDLTGSVKPYLLTGIANNLGAETTLTYAPSTQFYVHDEMTGTPWITRLPFPVHVVAGMQTTEAITGTSIVSSYSYHHGFYDGVEREFRGFARVDQLDAEALPQDSGIGQFTSTPATSGGEFNLPPVLRRSWYHTGAYFGGEDIAARLAREFYQGDPQAPQLSATTLPADAGAEEQREACRALRGHLLREEVYAQDRTPSAVNPYTTTEYRYQVDRLQPPSGASYGAYYGWELESASCHYERDPSDPRVAHRLTLSIDQYGNPTASAAVGYPRRSPEFDQQTATLVRYTQNDYANIADQPGCYRLGLPVEHRSYELTGESPTRPDGLFDHDTLRDAASKAAVINYEDSPSGTVAQRRLLECQRTIYLADDLSAPLPKGHADSLALVDRTYRLFYTPGLLEQRFVSTGKLSAASLASQLSGPGAFVDLDGDGNQWAPSVRTLYSPDPSSPDPALAAQHFYLPQGAIDPWGNVSAVAYDVHDLLVIQTVDAVQNTIVAKSNYRVLAPWLMTDANLNRTGVRFDPLGMVIATAEMGKLLPSGEDEGDHFDTSTAEPSATDDPTTRLEYDLSAYQTWASDPAHDTAHQTPAWAHTLARVRHQDPTTPWLETYVYSDGLGRVVLTKAQAEPGEAPVRDASGNLVRDAEGKLVFAPTETRWVGTGRVVYDNKANPVKAYEPFFDSSPVYNDEGDLVLWGVTAVTRYDPLSRAYRIDNPDGSYRLIELDPWGTITSDENDTVLDSAWYSSRDAGQLGPDHADAASKAAADAATPALASLDPLGRIFETVADNGSLGQYTTVLTLDIEGQVLVTTDALGRAVLTSLYCPGRLALDRASVDAGERWMLYDAGGRHLTGWDTRQQQIRHEYDALRRPTNLYVTSGSDPERLAERAVYGEGLADAQQLNLRGVAYQHYDEAGFASIGARNFQGNVVSASRQLLEDYVDDVNWSAGPALDLETFTSSTTYDALNRVIAATAPDGSITTPTFNERSLLASVSVTLHDALAPATIVDSVTYDAKGQRQAIVYGNGATTTYTYDPDTFRLTQLTTTRPGDGGPLQDLRYFYDPVGNITRLNDRAQQTIFFDNQIVTPSADYTYDAVYRLIRASGREHAGQSGPVPPDSDDSAQTAVPLPSDGQAMVNYIETYGYDAVGNFQSVGHTASSGAWTRTYAYDEPNVPPTNNQLTSTTVRATTERYSYDANGNLASMPQLSLMQWDWKDQLRATATQIVGDGNPPTTYYRYDSLGQRVTRVTNNQHGTRSAQRTYLGGYEVYREYDPTGAVTLERHTLHVSDGSRRICLLETTTVDATPVTATSAPVATPSTVTRYQLDNHLGSALLELDGSAAILTYEEYYPYGSTSFQSGPNQAEVSLKRYRYTGKERDTESGFYYCGARYYAPWLGRWTSCDPAGIGGDGTGVYTYSRCQPITRTDPNGRQSESWVEVEPTEPDATDQALFGTDWARHSTSGYTDTYRTTPGEADAGRVLVFGDDAITGKRPTTSHARIQPVKPSAPKPAAEPTPAASPPSPPAEAPPTAPAPATPSSGEKTGFERFGEGVVEGFGQGLLYGVGGALAIAAFPEIALGVAVLGALSLGVGIGELITGEDLGGRTIDRAGFAGNLIGSTLGAIAGGGLVESAVTAPPPEAPAPPPAEIPAAEPQGSSPPALPQRGTRQSPTFDWRLARSDDAGMEHLGSRHAPWSTEPTGGKFTQEAWNDLKQLTSETVENGTVGTLKPDAAGRPQAGVVYEHGFGRQVGVSARGKPLFRIRVVVDANNHVTTAFPF